LIRNLLTFNAILVAVVSLTSLLAPTFFLQTNGLDITQSTINLQRAFGAVAIGYAVASWLLREQTSSQARRAFLLGAGLSYLVFAVVNVVNILALPQASPFGWGFFTLNLVLGAVFTYCGVRDPYLR
jgi:hypothetical protein